MIFSKLPQLDKLMVLLIILFPLFLITGPFLADLCVSILGLFAIYKIYKEIKIFIKIYKIFTIYLAWCLYLIFNSFISNDPSLSLESSLFYFRFGFFVLAIFYIDSIFPASKKYYFYAIMFFLLVLNLDGLFQFFFGYNLLGSTYDGYRISGFFGEEKILGSYIVRILPVFIAFYLYQTEDNDKIKILFLITLLLSMLLIFLSGERTAFILLVILFGVLFFFIKSLKRINIFLITLSFFTFLSLSLFNNKFYERMVTLTFIQLQEVNYINFSNAHKQHYSSAIKMFYSNPITGIGTKLFRVECKKEQYYSERACSTHPHNTYIQLLAETGIIGTIPIAMVFILTFYYYLKTLFKKFISKNFSYNEYFTIILCAVLINFWPIIPSGNFFNNWLSAIYYYPLGFVLSYINSQKK